MAVNYLKSAMDKGVLGSNKSSRTTTGSKKKSTTTKKNRNATDYLSGSLLSARTGGVTPTVPVKKVAPTTTTSRITPTSTVNTPQPTAAALGNVTSAGAGADQNIMDQDFTGWAQGMRPDAAQTIFQEPQALLRQVMASMGMSANSNPGMYHMALPNADLVNALAMLQLGGTSNFDQGNINSVINTMGDMFSQGLTRGGQGIDFRSGLNNAMTAGTGTALGDFLNLDDPRGQVQAMSSLLMPLAEAGLHPLFAQAFQAEINRLADEYYSRVGFGDPGGDFQDMLARRLTV